ncbi:MAG: hypothetical protein OSA48_00645 [Akkermansiaceae bacterium]|nr:hypothetical protein [Akkermansiaceae bacterium]
MKSFVITLFTVAGVAHLGAFFETWEISLLGDDHLTAEQVGERLGKAFDFTNDLREIRDDLREQTEGEFAKSP